MDLQDFLLQFSFLFSLLAVEKEAQACRFDVLFLVLLILQKNIFFSKKAQGRDHIGASLQHFSKFFLHKNELTLKFFLLSFHRFLFCKISLEYLSLFYSWFTSMNKYILCYIKLGEKLR